MLLSFFPSGAVPVRGPRVIFKFDSQGLYMVVNRRCGSFLSMSLKMEHQSLRPANKKRGLEVKMSEAPVPPYMYVISIEETPVLTRLDRRDSWNQCKAIRSAPEDHWTDTPCKWQVDDLSMELLFEKHFSKHSVGAYMQLYQEVGRSLQVVPFLDNQVFMGVSLNKDIC